MYRRFSLSIIALLATLCISAHDAVAQSARDTAFCRSIVDNECVGLIPDGATVSISSLSEMNGSKTIFFWGNLRNPNGNPVAFFFTRDGECYDKDPISPSSKALRKLSGTEQIIGILNSLTFREVWHALGISSTEVGSKDIKANVVFIPQANEYRIYDYRFALCPGSFSARIINSEGDPISGNNDLDIIVVD